jgi:hypothetical protein
MRRKNGPHEKSQAPTVARSFRGWNAVSLTLRHARRVCIHLKPSHDAERTAKLNDRHFTPLYAHPPAAARCDRRGMPGPLSISPHISQEIAAGQMTMGDAALQWGLIEGEHDAVYVQCWRAGRHAERLRNAGG